MEEEGDVGQHTYSVAADRCSNFDNLSRDQERYLCLVHVAYDGICIPSQSAVFRRVHAPRFFIDPSEQSMNDWNILELLAFTVKSHEIRGKSLRFFKKGSPQGGQCQGREAKP